MPEYRLTPRAEADLRDIWHFVARDSEKAADALILRILDRLELAAGQPRIGPARPEVGARARTLVEGRYIIIYEPTEYGILAVAVVHGMRNPENWLE